MLEKEYAKELERCKKIVGDIEDIEGQREKLTFEDFQKRMKPVISAYEAARADRDNASDEIERSWEGASFEKLEGCTKRLSAYRGLKYEASLVWVKNSGKEATAENILEVIKGFAIHELHYKHLILLAWIENSKNTIKFDDIQEFIKYLGEGDAKKGCPPIDAGQIKQIYVAWLENMNTIFEYKVVEEIARKTDIPLKESFQRFLTQRHISCIDLSKIEPPEGMPFFEHSLSDESLQGIILCGAPVHIKSAELITNVISFRGDSTQDFFALTEEGIKSADHGGRFVVLTSINGVKVKFNKEEILGHPKQDVIIFTIEDGSKNGRKVCLLKRELLAINATYEKGESGEQAKKIIESVIAENREQFKPPTPRRPPEEEKPDVPAAPKGSNPSSPRVPEPPIPNPPLILTAFEKGAFEGAGLSVGTHMSGAGATATSTGKGKSH